MAKHGKRVISYVMMLNQRDIANADNVKLKEAAAVLAKSVDDQALVIASLNVKITDLTEELKIANIALTHNAEREAQRQAETCDAPNPNKKE